MGTIRVNPGKLQAAASDFADTASIVQNLTREMTSIVSGLSGQVWSGGAAVAYVQKFNSLQDEMDRICQNIRHHSEELILMASQYETARNDSEDIVPTLSRDVII